MCTGRSETLLFQYTRSFFYTPDNSGIKINIFFSSPKKKYIVDINQKRPNEVLLVSTHNICFYGEIKKENQHFMDFKKKKKKKKPNLELCEFYAL